MHTSSYTITKNPGASYNNGHSQGMSTKENLIQSKTRMYTAVESRPINVQLEQYAVTVT